MGTFYLFIFLYFIFFQGNFKKDIRFTRLVVAKWVWLLLRYCALLKYVRCLSGSANGWDVFRNDNNNTSKLKIGRDLNYLALASTKTGTTPL